MNNKDIIEALSNITVLELCDLARELENKWGLVGVSCRTGYTGFPQLYTPVGTPIFYK